MPFRVRLKSLAGGREVAYGGNGEGVKAPQEAPCVPLLGIFLPGFLVKLFLGECVWLGG